jgi:hypothetical protein
MQKQTLLKFSKGDDNAKLQQISGKLYSFSLPSGFTCPFSLDCMSKAIEREGKITIVDGKHTKFRCFSASQELVYTATRKQRWHNFEILRKLKTVDEMYEIIQKSLPKDATIIRIHVGGDFFSKNYFQSFIKIAKNNPNIIFYAYTKSLNYWVELINEIPSNLKLNASRGGKSDHLIDEYNLKSAEVVFSEQEAIDKGLEIDHDDTHAFKQDKSFALLLHGVQPAGTEASKALQILKKEEKGSYNREKIKKEMTDEKKFVNAA